MRKLAALALVAPLLAVAPGRATGRRHPVVRRPGGPGRPRIAAGVKVVEDCVTSVPDPGSSTPVQICYSLFKPAGASRRHPVPMIWHSHGWGGSRTTDPAAFATFLDGGYGVLSFDQRGFGESGGHAYVENPAVEGKDVARLIRVMARLPLGPAGRAGRPAARRDRRLLRRRLPVPRRLHEPAAPRRAGARRDGARDHLARPQREPRPRGRRPHRVGGGPVGRLGAHRRAAARASTRRWSRGPRPARGRTGPSRGPRTCRRSSRRNGPAFHVAQGRRLDIPVLLGQGTTDSLFPLQQGLANWERALTRKARRDSIFVAYNGGHVLPGVAAARHLGDLRPVLDAAGRRRLRGAEQALLRRAAQGPAHRAARLRPAPPRHPGLDVHHDPLPRPDGDGARRDRDQPDGGRRAAGLRDRAGPLRLAGTPHLTGTMTALGVHNRAFYGLAVGTSPADATLVQNNVLPVDEPGPVVGRAAPRSTCPRWRSTSRPGSGSTCSSRRSATPSWAWAAARRAWSRSRKLEHTCPSCHPDPFTVERVPASNRLTAAATAGALACALVVAATPDQRRPRVLPGGRARRSGPRPRRGPGRRRPGPHAAPSAARSRTPARCCGRPGQTSDGVRGEIAEAVAGRTPRQGHGDQRRHLRHRPRHPDPRVGPGRRTRPDPRQPAHRRPQRHQHLGRPPRQQVRRTPQDREPVRGPARAPSAPSTATSSTSPTPASPSARRWTASAASSTARRPAGSRRTPPSTSTAAATTSARW